MSIQASNTTTGQGSFQLVRKQEVPALNLVVEEYDHHPTGAKHFHLAADAAENVFMVAFRTVPEDSTGVAHMLEHTVLCGSERYPVRDPFFLMIRRSLNTFMNAFTASDYTAYPFASQNRKDYFNLMSVYLDAVFFSRLDPLDFAQEGHRLEFEEAGDAETDLVYRGVVYNEMKGDSSSPMSMLYHAIQEALYPTSTYHFKSGGDPRNIPDLSYEGLLEFYRTHYHPSNAVFMTYGDIPAEEQQAKISELALDRFESLAEVPVIEVSREQRYGEPQQREVTYPVDDDDLAQKTHIVIAWLLGENTDLDQLLECHLLSDVLLDTSASPMRLALETCEFATAVSPMCGFEEDHRETSFMCGVEGSEAAHADAVEAMILAVLEDVAENGVPFEQLEAVLHQLELSQRELGGDGYPYGLQLMFSSMSAAVHRGDPIGLLDLEPALVRIREKITDPDYIKGLVKRLLLDNPHRVRVVMSPDRAMGKRLIEDEKARLATLKSAMSDADATNVIELASALADRQAQPDQVEVLPKVGMADVPAEKVFPEIPAASANGMRVTSLAAGTNGITYHQVVRALPAMPAELAGLLPVYGQIISEVGSAGRGYMETQLLQHARTGGINGFASLRTLPADPGSVRGYFTLSSRTLNDKMPDLVSLLKDTSSAPNFTESERIRDLLAQMRARRVNSVAGNGHQYAMQAAAATLREIAGVNNFLGGIPAVTRLRDLDDGLDEASNLDNLCARLQALHELITQSEPMFLFVGEEGMLDACQRELAASWGSRDSTLYQDFHLEGHEGSQGPVAYITTTQVNYCATAYATVPETHEDAAALTVLAGVLRNKFLHTELREKGGAYGGGANHDASAGVFRFYSYRDPNISETFDTFERSIDWALTTSLDDDMLEEAILGIVSSIDAPGSPAGELRQAYHHELYGRSAAHRSQARARYLDVSAGDLRSVAEKYLTGEPNRALVSSENRLDEIGDAFTVVQI